MAGRVHQLQAFFLFLRGRHNTFVYLAAYPRTNLILKRIVICILHTLLQKVDY
jgi:hypothetical protein